MALYIVIDKDDKSLFFSLTLSTLLPDHKTINIKGKILWSSVVMIFLSDCVKLLLYHIHVTIFNDQQGPHTFWPIKSFQPFWPFWLFNYSDHFDYPKSFWLLDFNFNFKYRSDLCTCFSVQWASSIIKDRRWQNFPFNIDGFMVR